MTFLQCILDPTDPDGPCIPCQSISRTSKKTIHRTPCFHNKITDTVLFRSGGLGLTRRWTGTEMKNIVTPVQARNFRTIEFTQSSEQKPIVIKVVPFEPIEGDITSRFWTVVENGVVVQKSKEIKPFCLANIRRTAIYFEQYIRDNAIPDFKRRGAPGSRANAPMSSYDPIQATYHMAVELYDNLPDEVRAYEGGALVANRERRLLGNLFTLSFAIRQTTGSAYICGEDTLDMAPETDDPSYPLQGKVSLPRMLLAQFDSINHTKLLVPLRMKVLRELEYLIVQNKKHYWFTIYVCIFILLREASWITEDRSRHAKAVHQAKIRYSIPGFVESLQEGCNTLLMFWHYYNCRPMPTSVDAAAHHTSFLSELTVEQYNLVMWTMTNPGVQEQLSMWRTYRTENGFIPEPEQPNDGETAYMGNQRKLPWDHPYYWIAQLFEEDWTPHPTYKREYI
ncbi:unnamed protein product [Clonostachys byssicola]|uniref:Uncharacterized protein n=1 Tax=Clonostachys byssicola TaxID=160290 RepID=A0A9N9UPV5_9HYPO|nr:unnamed protein product [Clonostachys byssicola]